MTAVGLHEPVIAPKLLFDLPQQPGATLQQSGRFRSPRRRGVLLTPRAQCKEGGQQVDAVVREAVDRLLGMRRIIILSHDLIADQHRQAIRKDIA